MFYCNYGIMAVYRVVSEIFNAEKYHDLEIPVKGHLRSLKVVPFDRLCMVSYQCSIVTLALRCSISKMPWLWKPG